MLRINDLEIPLSHIIGPGSGPDIIYEDCFSLMENAINKLEMSWEPEDGIEFIELELSYQTAPQQPVEKRVISLSGSGKSYVYVFPQTFVSLLSFTVIIEGKRYDRAIEIQPRKIDERMFYRLLENLQEIHHSIYMKESPARTFINTPKLQPFSTLIERYEAIKKDMAMLQRVVDRISENPRKKLRTEYERLPLPLAHDVDENTVFDMCVVGGGLSRSTGGAFNRRISEIYTDRKGNKFLPETVLSSRVEIDYDVFENRLLKRFLKLISLNMKSIENMAGHIGDHEKSSEISDECRRMKQLAMTMSRFSFLDNVKEEHDLLKTSLALRSDITYMRFYDIYKRFISRPYFDRSDIFNIGINELWQLYEYWCCAVVYQVLSEFDVDGWSVEPGGFLTYDELGYETKFIENQPLLTLRREIDNIDETVTLFFQRKMRSFIQERSQKGSPKKPDVVLEYKKSERLANVLILDAKYRSDLFREGTENSSRSAINDMHVYRDAFRDTRNDGIRKCGWAVILYPGENTSGSASIHNKLGWDDGDLKSGIAALCLRPADDIEVQKRMLKQMIQSYLLNRDMASYSNN